MKGINLSAWAIEHPSMVRFLLAMLLLLGTMSYYTMGRNEEPPHIFRVMIVSAQWPGATATEVEQQLTERLEKELQDIPWLEALRSSSKPGESLIFIDLLGETPAKEVPEIWRQVRKKLYDVRDQLPPGVQGPYPNDDFGDMFMNIFALSGEDFSAAELRREADRIALELRHVPDVQKVHLIGVQPEKIYIEAQPTRLAALGITQAMLADALGKQNIITPAGFVETPVNRIRLRVTGEYDTVDQVRATDIVLGGRHIRLGDIATVTRGFAEPAAPRMRANGADAIGIGVVMADGGDIIQLGKNLQAKMENLKQTLPAGIRISTVTDQPTNVSRQISTFVETLFEAVLIVLAVSFISLGWRTGAIVALSIPLVLAITFMVMQLVGIDLQRISLGALVVALGLLVDDAIIAVEMMAIKLEQGVDRFKAATFAYTSTAFPMLTGTLITAAGFTPIAFAKSAAGEMVLSMFWVVVISLLASWVVAVVFIPYLGYLLLDAEKLRKLGQQHHGDIYDTPFYRRLRGAVEWCLLHRWTVILSTLGALILAIVAFNTIVERTFFPPATGVEIVVDLWLPQDGSMTATADVVHRAEKLVANAPEVESFSSYIGVGAPYFYITQEQQLANDNYGQLLIRAKSLASREALKERLEAEFAAPDGRWAHVHTRVQRLDYGPPIGYPVQFRVIGRDLTKLRQVASEVASLIAQQPDLKDVNLDWNNQVKSLRVVIDQERARALGVSSQEISQSLQAWLVGVPLTQFREGDQMIDIVWRAAGPVKHSLEHLPDLDIVTASGRHVPLAQVARLQPVVEDGLIWRRNRAPTITVRADAADKGKAQPIAEALDRQLDTLRAKLPPGFRIELGGAVEVSGKAERPIIAALPLMLVITLTLLMMQLQSIGRTIIVLLTAPLGMIGVTLAMIIFHAPFGFVATVGVIALMGMIMRNSVILIDQIAQDEAAGYSQWDAIVGSVVRRFRPIVLTAAASLLAMIPLTRQAFWGPMAMAIMGGIIVATVLTVLFLPALYAAWYWVKKPLAGQPGDFAAATSGLS
ncbi:MAG: efflux RND transporter permease subunit [Rugosibacter sp.]